MPKPQKETSAPDNRLDLLKRKIKQQIEEDIRARIFASIALEWMKRGKS